MRDVPPELIKGSVMPFGGINDVADAIWIKHCPKKHTAIPHSALDWKTLSFNW